MTIRSRLSVTVLSAVLGLSLAVAAPDARATESMAFRTAVAEAAYGAEAIGDHYRESGYAPLFTGPDDGERRRALLAALAEAPRHGLPAGRHDPETLRAALRGATTERGRGRAEAVAARMLVAYARDVTSGVLEPARIDPNIVRQLPRPDPRRLLAEFAEADPHAFLRGLIPDSAEYARLLATKMRMERRLAAGGWGRPVPVATLRPGQSGPAVVALRDRLIAMGYLERTALRRYGPAVEKAVLQFQMDHGLEADGVAGTATIEEINVPLADRLSQVLVAMERERWLNGPPPETGSGREVLVNLTDFSARILDDDVVTFQTRSIIGEADPDKQTPEFSDVMEYMEINPDWTVPRGIIRRSYLPQLRANRYALGHLQVVNSRGEVVPRSRVNFARYSARSFPYNLRQPPGPSNALGTVKFMFPNTHAIYLHDTPDKSLFGNQRRAFSNGCIRLNDPHDFAYHLLARQTTTPERDFDRILNSGRQTRLPLEDPVPVHLIYRTAFTQAKGRINYRPDVYGRDAELWAALQRAGVSLPVPRG